MCPRYEGKPGSDNSAVIVVDINPAA